jgi:hypothetical protein
MKLELWLLSRADAHAYQSANRFRMTATAMLEGETEQLRLLV